MNDQLVEIKLHGVLAEQVGREVWNLAVSSVGEAVRALESQSKKLYKNLIKNDKKNIKYRVLINEKDFLFDEEKDINTKEGLNSSELVREYQNLKSIDIVPVVEGADAKDIFAIIAGIVLIVLGVFTFGATTQMGMMLIAGGLGLMAAGIANLLTPMPEFGDFREIEGGGRASYIFSGPENTVREGGPVFIGYGRLLVGSQVVQSSIQTFDVKNDNIMNTSDLVRNIGQGATQGQHWGLENYGLDYRDEVGFLQKKDDVFTTERVSSDRLMKARREEWNRKDVDALTTAGHCPTDIGGITKKETFLKMDGDDFSTYYTGFDPESIVLGSKEYTSDGLTLSQIQNKDFISIFVDERANRLKAAGCERYEDGTYEETCYNQVIDNMRKWLEDFPKD